MLSLPSSAQFVIDETGLANFVKVTRTCQSHCEQLSSAERIMDSVRVYCAPVKRAPFEYDWHDLQVNRISRCPPSDLHALLTWVDKGPVLTKKGKPRVHQGPPSQGQAS